MFGAHLKRVLGIHLGFGTWDLEFAPSRSFDGDLYAILNFTEGFGIGQNLSDHVDGAGRPNLIAPTRRSGARRRYRRRFPAANIPTPRRKRPLLRPPQARLSQTF